MSIALALNFGIHYVVRKIQQYRAQQRWWQGWGMEYAQVGLFSSWDRHACARVLLELFPA